MLCFVSKYWFSPCPWLFLLLCLGPVPANFGAPRITEFMAANDSALADEDGLIEPALFGIGMPEARRWDGQHTLRETLDADEAETIREALRQADSNVSRAARALGVSRQHLHNRMNAHGIRRSRTLSESAKT